MYYLYISNALSNSNISSNSNNSNICSNSNNFKHYIYTQIRHILIISKFCTIYTVRGNTVDLNFVLGGGGDVGVEAALGRPAMAA